jgi:hypothetical protein
MTSVTQMSFQNKAAGAPAFLFRNDRKTGPFSGPSCFLSITNYHFSILNCQSSSAISGLTSAFGIFVDFTFRKPLIYRLLTLSNLNKKIFFDQHSRLLPCLVVGKLVSAWHLAFGFWSFPLTQSSHVNSHINVIAKNAPHCSPPVTCMPCLQKSARKKSPNSHINVTKGHGRSLIPSCKIDSPWQNPIMFHRLPLLLALCLPFAGCGPKSQKTVPQADRTETASPTAAPEQDLTAVLSELTQAVRKFSAEQRRVPGSLDELVPAGYLKQLPAPPAGKTFVIDQKELRVAVK